MADFELDFHELEAFAQELESLQKNFPKQARQLMLRSGTKARAIVSKKARRLVRKDTGNYFRSIKRGKVWFEDGSYRVRVYSGAPHAHLIEYGHRIVNKSKTKEYGFKEGYYVFDKSVNEITNQWNEIVSKEFDRILDKL